MSARLPDDEEDQPKQPVPAAPAEQVKDWDLPDLPPECGSGLAPELLTDAQAQARIEFGFGVGWVQRRVAVFAAGK
ncbi:hypothetical protein [Streptomyces sp. NPDC092952]|uniref:hypothetical protein n=1 Tax=Streptomyces sp. NPDC092952 TaxID=3366018 RepID=UPI003825DB66